RAGDPHGRPRGRERARGRISGSKRGVGESSGGLPDATSRPTFPGSTTNRFVPEDAMFRTRTHALLALIALGGCVAAGDNEADLVARAREIHDRVMAMDTHVDIPFNFATEEV